MRLPPWDQLPRAGDVRWPFLAILTLYVVLGITVLGFNRSPVQVLYTVAATCALDMLCHWLLRSRTLLFPLSAAISGMGLSILVNYAHNSWLPLVPVFFTVASKYLLTFQGRHVFNPTLFGLVASLWLMQGMISPSPAYQWGGSIAMAAFVVTAALVVFVFRIGRNALLISFLGFYAAALTLRAWIMQWHMPPETLFLGALTSPAFYLFTFFMITDPRTSPAGPRAQVLMSLTIVALDFALQLQQKFATLFWAGFAYFAARLLLLHLRAAWQAGWAYWMPALRAGLRPAVVLLPIALLGGALHRGYSSAAPTADFRFVGIDATQAGLGAGRSDILEQVDPRIQHVAKWLLSVGDAVATADFDQDGRQDLFLSYPLKQPGERAALYRNLGGFRFERVPLPDLSAAAARPEQHGLPSGALFFDPDNDGDQDLLVLMGYGRSRYLRNRLAEDGAASFVDESAASGLDALAISVAANAADLDRDGRVDLLIGNAFSPYLRGYAQPTPLNVFRLPAPAYPGDRRMFDFMHRSWHDANNGGGLAVYLNRGGAHFERMDAAALGIDGRRWTLAIGTGDLDQDGWTDLYLANDFGPDQLLLNQAGRGFRSLRGRWVGQVGHDTYKGMNASLGDLDGDGRPDIYVSNVHHKLQAEGSLLWLNRADGPATRAADFRDAAAARHALNEQRFGWGAALGDLDRDGRLDIVQVNGMVDDSYDRRHAPCPDYWYWNGQIALTGPEVHGYADRWADLRGRCIFAGEKNRVYLNRGREFVDVADTVGWSQGGVSRGIALSDLDDDGDLDAIVTHQFAPASLYRNDAVAKAWIGLALEGDGQRCNRSALGTRLRLVEKDGAGRERSMLREVQAANGFSAQGDARLLFGLGALPGPAQVSVEIHWCGASRPQVLVLATNRYHRLYQPGSGSGPAQASSGSSLRAPASPAVATWSK